MKNMTITLKKYKKELALLNTELQKLPSGIMLIRNNRYYQRIDGKEMGITKNKELIQQFCRKKYLLEQKKRLEKNIKTLEKSVENLTEATPDEIISSLPTIYQNMSIENFYHSTVVDWTAKPYRQNSYRPEERKYETKNGVKVRSKSELIIANLLEEYQILYRYEPEMTLGGKGICPDFVIRNPFTSEQIIWEHFGALHLPEYEKKMNEKMERYFAEGLVSFETVIYTFEFDLNAERLKNIIEKIILE